MLGSVAASHPARIFAAAMASKPGADADAPRDEDALPEVPPQALSYKDVLLADPVGTEPVLVRSDEGVASVDVKPHSFARAGVGTVAVGTTVLFSREVGGSTTMAADDEGYRNVVLDTTHAG